jgi:hypothetical protein
MFIQQFNISPTDGTLFADAFVSRFQTKGIRMKLHLALAGIAAIMVSAAPANAATTIFSGQDDGAGVAGPWVNSSAAEAAFKAAAGAFGAVKTETFEGATVGALSPVVLDDLTITTPAPNFGLRISGVNDTTFGNLYGFNVTAGGSKWYGFPNFAATQAFLTFDAPTNSLGFWLTGIQAEFTASIDVELLDGSKETFSLPVNTAGGVQFWGVVSDIAFTKVLAVQTNNPGVADAFGLDNISYNGAVVPEPATWAMMIMGFGLVGFAARRRRATSVTA